MSDDLVALMARVASELEAQWPALEGGRPLAEHLGRLPATCALVRAFILDTTPRGGGRDAGPVPVPRLIYDLLCVAALAGLDAAGRAARGETP